MAQGKQRLELTWIGKENRPRLEPRILLEDPEKSYHAKQRVSDKDIFDNRLIFGDNLLALKALEQEFARKIKCIYIDPPFNTGEMFEHYDDGVEHSLWLTQMRDRLVILHRLLADDGTLFVHIDDNELAYLTVLLDEIFTRKNRLYTVTFKQGSATGHKSINPGCVSTTNYVLIYAKEKSEWKPNRVFTGRDRDTRYGQYITNIDDSHESWNIITLTKAFAKHLRLSDKDARKLIKEEPAAIEDFVMKFAKSVVRTARPDYDAVSEAARDMIDQSKVTPSRIVKLERADHSDMYFKNGERILFYFDKLKLVDGEYVAGEPLTTLWDDILSNNLHNEGGVDFPKGKKPEHLIKRTLDLSTTDGDWVLDSFAGSGTTAAVAHKMKRRWINVELGEHAQTHIIPRLRRVIDGQDSSGVTEATGWRGGGGFRYFHIAPSLLDKDRFGQDIISKQYNAAMLSEAMCKIMGFNYAPSDEIYWQQGNSTENDFLYVTTQTLSREQLAKLSDEVGDNRSLLVCCAAFRGKADAFPNLTIKKIPSAVLAKCEWGHDDYSLNVANLPKAAPPPEPIPEDAQASTPKQARRRTAAAQPSLFSPEAQGGTE
jgi:adenine-specific DNA-methyltransferase